MTGRMSDKGDPLPYPVAWLPLMDANDAWTPAPPLGEAMQSDRYDLLLTAADDGVTEYVMGRAYSLFYARGSLHGGIGGDLRSPSSQYR